MFLIFIVSGNPTFRVEEVPLMKTQNHNSVAPLITKQNIEPSVKQSLLPSACPPPSANHMVVDSFHEDKLMQSIMKNSRENPEPLSKQSSCESSQLISFSPRKNLEINGKGSGDYAGQLAMSGNATIARSALRSGGGGVLKKSMSASNSTVNTRSSSTCISVGCSTKVNCMEGSNKVGVASSNGTPHAYTKIMENSNNRMVRGTENYAYR